MLAILFVGALVLFNKIELNAHGKQFSKPSEAFAYANAPIADWAAAVKAGLSSKSPIAPNKEAQIRANALCPSFAIDSVSGEELYWLAKLCEHQPATGRRAIERYLAGTGLEHRPEAHLMLSIFQMHASRSWVPAWGTLRTILQEDPFESDQEVRIRVAIEGEAYEDEKTALKWAEERYSLLKDRMESAKSSSAAGLGRVGDHGRCRPGASLLPRRRGRSRCGFAGGD